MENLAFSFKRFLKEKWTLTRARFLLVMLLLAVFVSFRAIQRSDAEQLLSTISSILRNESMTANTYILAKSFSDIESLRILDCTMVADGMDARRLFYDTSLNPGCYMNSWLARFRTATLKINSINGISFEVKIQPKLDSTKIAFECLVYLFITLVFWQANRLMEQRKLAVEARVRAIELEKQLMLDHTSQIRHDIASPLSAINMIIKIIPQMDPEVRNVLNKAMARTQELFNDLSQTTQNKSKNTIDGTVAAAAPPVENNLFSISNCVSDIFEEKKLLFSSNANLTLLLDQPQEGSSKVRGQDKELKRVLSNLINNSAEALSNEGGTITIGSRTVGQNALIYILDDGKGMTPEVLNKIGTKGFSFGKESSNDSGSGLGIHHAISTIESWNGKVVIQSKPSEGTLVQIQLPIVSC